MRIFYDLTGNYVLMCSLAGWFSAQTLKIFTALVKEKKFDLRKFFSNGGMPSSHTSTVCALCLSIGKTDGFKSSTFALSFMLAFIVMVDATGVRRAAGEQAKILNQLVYDMTDDKPVYMKKKLKELIGHTPLEVIVGALLGALIVLIIPTY